MEKKKKKERENEINRAFHDRMIQREKRKRTIERALSLAFAAMYAMKWKILVVTRYSRGVPRARAHAHMYIPTRFKFVRRNGAGMVRE